MDCTGCIHEKICELWCNAEGQDASCYDDSCKETLAYILGDDYDLDRLNELAEADKEGRLIVSPCKIGDIVWSAHELIGLNSHQIRRIERNNEGDFVCSALMFGFEDFGKIWFLHKQEAESALERMEGEEK